LQEALHQISQVAPGECRIETRGAPDVGTVDAREVPHHVTGICVAEHKPGLPFVRDAAVGLNGYSCFPQQAHRAMEERQFVLGPASLAATNIGQVHSAVTHWIPR
jgi:hypothetical protein